MQLLLILHLTLVYCISLTSAQNSLQKCDNSNNNSYKSISFPQCFFEQPPTVIQLHNESINNNAPSKTQPHIFDLLKKSSLLININNLSDLLSEKCRKSSEVFLKGIENYELWALKMLDSTAKIPSGILSGNVNQFGDYDGCLTVDQAQYCLAEIDLAQTWGGPYMPFRDLVHSYFPFKGTFDDPQHRVPDFNMIKWGICLPSECTPEDLQHFLEQQIGVVARVQPSMCIKATPSRAVWSFGDYFARLFFALLLLAVTVSSLFAWGKASFLTSSESKLVKILLAFSLPNNWKELLDVDGRDTNRNKKMDNVETSVRMKENGEIQGVHGIRALSALALLMCHKSVALMYNPYINRTQAMENFGLPWTVIGRTAIVYTDSFMLLSGLLTANSLIKDLEVRGSMQIKDKFITRIFRITPNIVALILFCTYILPNISSGPLWPIVVQQHSDLCKKYMWRNLLFVHNHFGFENMCLTHTHQVGIDMQLFLFTPFLVYLWWKNKKLGVYAAGTIAIMSTILRYWTTVRHNLSHLIYFGITVEKMFDTANYSYILPSHRATIYTMGVLLAYILKNVKVTLNKFQTGVCWTAALAFALYAIMGFFTMAKRGYVYNSMDAAIFGAFSPIWWGIALAWVIFASNSDHAGWLGDFLSWRGFRLFTKIAYAFYLVQFPVIFYNVGVQKNAYEFRKHDLLEYTETSIIIFLSIVLTLCVEMPFQKIKKILFNSTHKQDSTAKHHGKVLRKFHTFNSG